MVHSARVGLVGLVGRDAEIAEIQAFHSATSGRQTALLITGEPGIGKTAVWEHVTRAVSRSARVLSCQPALAERPLAFAALDDLIGGHIEEALPALPGPRRRAVELMLLRDPSSSSTSDEAGASHSLPERRALARGILDALRVIAAGQPLVLAVDDAQWLDRPSAAVLGFCLRRLQDEPVLVLLTDRGDHPVPLGLDRALPADRLRRVRLGPLSMDATGEILRSRLSQGLPPHVLSRVYEVSGGNPCYAIECARLLGSRPYPPPSSEPIRVPRTLSDLVRRRVRRLTPDVRRVGWLVAASPHPRERAIRAAGGSEESWALIDQAIDEGILERSGELLRFTPPLLRSVLYAEMTPGQRREAHRRLAAVAENVEERAWHLALGADRPDAEIAGMLDDAAEHAAQRGAAEEAAALAEQAARLTPADQPDEARIRTVRAADYYFRAGDMTRSRELIDSALAARPPGLTEWAYTMEVSAEPGLIGRLPVLDPSLVAGIVLKWCDRLDEARVKLVARYQRALEAGDETSLALLLYHISQLECWAGNWNAAEEYALQACQAAGEGQQRPVKPATLCSLALVWAHRGRIDEARDLAIQALGLRERTGNAAINSMALPILGFVALSLDDHQAAHAHLGSLADAAATPGLGEPGMVRFLPDEIESLVALGKLDAARLLTGRLEARGRSFDRPWALATAARCRAHLAAADGDLAAALAACEQALGQHERLAMPFELGRTVMVTGMIERRAKRKTAARETLGRALGIFERLGAPLWAAKAARELHKVAAHLTAGVLTETEHRLASLVAQGLTNRQVAAVMFVSENTVQTHVRHIFQKLGVRSRTELAARLYSGQAAGAAPVVPVPVVPETVVPVTAQYH
jgi:DNA-binding CsgD family transcriptional regulator